MSAGGAESQLRQRQRRARELLIRLLQVIQVQVAVAAGPDELAQFKIALLREHVRQQRVGGDVERHAQEKSALRWYSWQDRRPSAT